MDGCQIELSSEILLLVVHLWMIGVLLRLMIAIAVIDLSLGLHSLVVVTSGWRRDAVRARASLESAHRFVQILIRLLWSHDEGFGRYL